MEKKLNLGCGHFKKKGYINVDYVKEIKPDILHNLNRLPYPFKKNEFNLIEADHLLEHLNKPFEVMKELHRILKDKGILKIRIPHFSRGFAHPEHRAGFGVNFWNYFNPKFLGGYMGVEFKLKKLRLNWSSQPYLKKKMLPLPIYWILAFLNGIINFFANLSPFFCSRIWCFFVGGFEEIYYEFICIKDK